MQANGRYERLKQKLEKVISFIRAITFHARYFRIFIFSLLLLNELHSHVSFFFSWKR